MANVLKSGVVRPTAWLNTGSNCERALRNEVQIGLLYLRQRFCVRERSEFRYYLVIGIRNQKITFR